MRAHRPSLRNGFQGVSPGQHPSARQERSPDRQPTRRQCRHSHRTQRVPIAFRRSSPMQCQPSYPRPLRRPHRAQMPPIESPHPNPQQPESRPDCQPSPRQRLPPVPEYRLSARSPPGLRHRASGTHTPRNRGRPESPQCRSTRPSRTCGRVLSAPAHAPAD